MPDLIPPEAIAELLTREQRQALLWLPADGSDRPYPRQAEPEERLALMSLVSLEPEDHVTIRLAEPSVFNAFYRATTLGLRVQAVVERETGK